MRTFFLAVTLLLVTVTSVAAAEKTAITSEVVELDWLDLIPESERDKLSNITRQALAHNGSTALQSKLGEVRQELNGSIVKIPGFVIPLEGDANTITEFLLVPFYGACIHVPPPPPNQIIHVKFSQGAPVKELWDIVYITGTLKTESMVADDIEVESGYVIDGASLEVYNKA